MAILAITALISLWAGLRNALGPLGSQDNQWGPSRALLSHQDPYRLVLEQHEHPSRPAPFPLSQDPNYPAFGLVMLWPYASLPWPLAKVVWAVLNVFFTGLIVGGLFHLFLSSKPKWTLILVTGMLMTGTPFRVQIGNGQQALFSLGLFVLSIIFAEEEKDLLSAICLAASLFKYTVTLPLLPFFLVRRQWRIVLLAAGIDLGLTFFAAAWAQASPWQMMIGPVRSALLTTGQGYIDIRSIFGHIDMEAWSWLWIPAGGCMLLIAAAFCQRYGNGNELLVLSLMSVVSLLVFFHLAYDAVV
ncbi:MAG TPA: glycosyltransferase family 87 protein, partial [Verrucomicrobiae bacterium]|nr:glycosyltransferase family 87 protein [Verrucomicrobiae bacterium]